MWSSARVTIFSNLRRASSNKFILKNIFSFQFLVEQNNAFQKEKLQEDYNDSYPLLSKDEFEMLLTGCDQALLLISFHFSFTCVSNRCILDLEQDHYFS